MTDHVDPQHVIARAEGCPDRHSQPTKIARNFLIICRCFVNWGSVISSNSAHGESWSFDGGAVVSVPFYGEDPCDLEMPETAIL